MICMVQLCRYGDIINVLPLAKYWSQVEGHPVKFITSMQYADVLDGVSYVEPLIWTGAITDVRGAVAKFTHGKGYDVRISQVYGNAITRECDSFCTDSWKIVGMLQFWDRLPLIFDRRDPVREAALLSQLNFDWSKTILLSLGGTSSPYPYKNLLIEKLKTLPPGTSILDITNIRAIRIYDMLALFEKAAGMLTIDTSTAHLARAVPSMPFVCLTADKPSFWHGVKCGPNCVLSMRYFESQHRMQTITETLTSWLNLKST